MQLPPSATPDGAPRRRQRERYTRRCSSAWWSAMLASWRTQLRGAGRGQGARCRVRPARRRARAPNRSRRMRCIGAVGIDCRAGAALERLQLPSLGRASRPTWLEFRHPAAWAFIERVPAEPTLAACVARDAPIAPPSFPCRIDGRCGRSAASSRTLNRSRAVETLPALRAVLSAPNGRSA